MNSTEKSHIESIQQLLIHLILLTKLVEHYQNFFVYPNFFICKNDLICIYSNNVTKD